jgi:hypothetical protein
MGDPIIQADEHIRVSLSVHAKTEQDAIKALEALSRLAAGFAFDGLWVMCVVEREADDP